MVLFRSISRFALFIPLVACSLFSLSSCTPSNSQPAPTSDKTEEEYIYHRIKYSGETVAVISAWYTKSSKNWPEIVDANPKMIPSRLRIGDLVRIPKRLVKRFSSLPADFVSSFKSGVNQDTSKGGTLSPSTESPSGSKIDNGKDSTNDNGSVNEKSKDADNSGDSYNYRESTDTTKDSSGTSKEVEEEKKVDDSPGYGMQASDDSTSGPDTVEVKTPDVGSKAPEAAPPMNDENQKVRDQLMQELLQ